MAWKIEVTPEAKADLAKIDRIHAQRILKFLSQRLQKLPDPRSLGKALKGPALWRYRVGDYRLLCRIEDKILCILVVKIGHRSTVYTPRMRGL
jgi:mRNA interferase RelE/StbE